MADPIVRRVRLPVDLVSLLLDLVIIGYGIFGNDEFELGGGYKNHAGHGRKALFISVQSSEQSVELSIEYELQSRGVDSSGAS